MVKGWLIEASTTMIAQGWPYKVGEVSPNIGFKH
jgi:hypothetical protein